MPSYCEHSWLNYRQPFSFTNIRISLWRAALFALALLATLQFLSFSVRAQLPAFCQLTYSRIISLCNF